MRCGAAVRAGELGFAAEPAPRGDVYRRRLETDLGAFLEGGAAPCLPVAELCRLDERLIGTRVDGSEALVLDVETVAIAAGRLAAFLVGVTRVHGTRLEVEQFLLADPASEAALLDAVGQRVRGAFLLTYNGRAFDMRVLGSRCVANGIHPAAMEPRVHLDLLPVTRRLFGAQMRGCTLRQAELRLLRYERRGEVAGVEGPARYRAWLRGAPGRVLAGVVEHNRLDVCCTAALAVRLVEQVGVGTTRMGAAARYNV